MEETSTWVEDDVAPLQKNSIRLFDEYQGLKKDYDLLSQVDEK